MAVQASSLRARWHTLQSDSNKINARRSRLSLLLRLSLFINMHDLKQWQTAQIAGMEFVFASSRAASVSLI